MELVKALMYTFLKFSMLNMYDNVYFLLTISSPFLYSYKTNGIIINPYIKNRQDIRIYFSAGIERIHGEIQEAFIVVTNTKNQAKYGPNC